MLDWAKQHKRHLAFFAIGIVLVVLLSTRSSSYQACHTDRETGYRYYEDPDIFEQTDSFFMCEGLFADANSELIVASATLALFVVTLLLWLSAKQSADIAGRALTDLERPYIFVWGIHSRPQNGNPPKFVYNVSNSGKMAAVIENVSIRVGFEQNGALPLPIIIGDHSLLQNPILAADQVFANIAYDAPAHLTEGHLPVELKDGCFFQVIINYRGPITNAHQTGQCWRYRKDNPRGFVEVSDARYTHTR